LIDAAADANPFKFNKYLIGSNIPIKKENEMHKTKPDYLLVLPYGFASAFMLREANMINNGAKFIVPLPKVKIIP